MFLLAMWWRGCFLAFHLIHIEVGSSPPMTRAERVAAMPAARYHLYLHFWHLASPSSGAAAVVIIMKEWAEDRIPCILVKAWYAAAWAEECVFEWVLTFTLLHVQTGSTVHYSLIMHSLCNANAVSLFQMPMTFWHTCHCITQFNASLLAQNSMAVQMLLLSCKRDCCS